TLPYAALNLVFNGGDSLLAENDQGLAAFTASLLTKGTYQLGAPDVQRFLSDRAASLNAASGRLTFSLSLDAPTRFLSDMFSLLRDTVSAPAMKEEEAARVRDNQIAAIVASEDQPTGLAFRRLFPFLFSAHPYGYVSLGQKDRVAAFSSEEARAFWARQSGQPWALSVCGSFDRDLVLEMAARLPAPQQEKSSPEAPVWNLEKELELRLPGRNQAHYFMVFPTVGYDDEDEPGLDLLRDILAGQSGLLFRDLRDKQGLGYTVTAFPWKSEKSGALIFYIGTEADKVTQADEGFRKIAASLRSDLLPEAELERGKNQMSADYYREHQSLGSRSAEAAMLTALGRPLGASRELVDKAKKLEAKQLRDLAQKYLDPARAYIVKVLP
ncbi:insulinase family protein, partial [Desulfovibrio sp. OttesenSCG-928-G11]|nr:insulinase family protein [Desulfovibrio sp. OttesenSCG-928-G11]